MDYEMLKRYNKWLRHGKVPVDKPYAVILPYDQAPAALASSKGRNRMSSSEVSTSSNQGQYQTHPSKYPIIKTFSNPSKGLKINGIKGVRLSRDMDYKSLEKATGVSIKRLQYYNDVTSKKRPRAGELWYLKPKKSRAQEQYHVVESGEDLWSISQKYGVKLTKLRKMNRMSRKQRIVKPGRLLWLQATRPKDVAVVYQSMESNEISTVTQDEGPSRAVAPAKPTPDTRQERQEIIENPPPVSPPKSAKSNQIVHVVQSGQTLYGISRQYQVSIADLRAWNNLSEADVLSVGQQVVIDNAAPSPVSETPSSEPQEAKFEVYSVKAGDTLYQIARDHNATIKELMEWNGKTDFNLSVGEELRVVKLP